jgi:hypothetical protein
VNLDELATAMKEISSDPVVLKLSDLVSAWKDDESDPKELESTVERYIGNTWITNTAEHKEIYNIWSQFRDDAIRGIGGMTVNEAVLLQPIASLGQCSNG